MTIATRIDELMKRRGIRSQSALARLSGVPQPTINRTLKGGTAPEFETIKRIAAALDVSATWLAEGGESPYTQTNEGNVEPGPDLKKRRYPVISWVQAGMWAEICENFEPAEDTEWRVTTVDLGPCGFVLRVKGRSMTAGPDSPYSFPDGMFLMVSPDAEAIPGKFVIVRRNGNEATFKRLSLVDDELYLEALNPDWPNQYIKMAPEDVIVGVVRAAQLDMP